MFSKSDSYDLAQFCLQIETKFLYFYYACFITIKIPSEIIAQMEVEDTETGWLTINFIQLNYST